MTRILVVNGPNLNMLGTREPDIYGATTLREIESALREQAACMGFEMDCYQSNHEGALIDRIQRRDFDWLIVNAGGLTHTSVSLRDALKGVDRPFMEVHISDPDTREEFRRVNFLRDIAAGTVAGKGAAGYSIALDEIGRRVKAAT